LPCHVRCVRAADGGIPHSTRRDRRLTTGVGHVPHLLLAVVHLALPRPSGTDPEAGYCLKER
jgi:hypothetical protein